jgi:hypothetical protein
MSAFMLQILFLANMSYFYGSAFRQGDRVEALKILALDYDGAIIGKALSGAYQKLQGKSFPALEYRSISDFPNPNSLRQAVCHGGYWGAIYTHPGASDRLTDAILDQTAAREYNASETITYIYNQARYPDVADSYVKGNLETLVSVSREVYMDLNGTAAIDVLDRRNNASIQAFLHPIQASSEIIQQTSQGPRPYLNTVSMVIPILGQFFFAMATHGVSMEVGILVKLVKRDNYFFRLIAFKIFNFFASLATAGYIWAFRENWDVSGRQFVETWMIYWLLMDINWAIIDTLLITLIPPAYFPFFILTWILTNIASCVFPFELSPGFYRLGYAFPAHQAYILLAGVWSGCHLNSRVTFPVLFAWWFVGHITSAISIRHRCLRAAREDANADKKPAQDSITVSEEDRDKDGV